MVVYISLTAYYQKIKPTMRRPQSKFSEYVLEADQLRGSGNFEAAKRLYKQAITFDFQQDEDSWELYYDARIHLGTVQKEAKEYANGRHNLEKCIKQLDSEDIEDKIKSRSKVIRLKFSALHNLAKLELSFSYSFKAVSLYQSYRKSLNTSFKHFKSAFDLIIEQLTKRLERGEMNNDEWAEEYLKIKSNYLQLIFQEGEEFNDKACFETILNDIQRAKRFAKHFTTQKIQIHLYRCYYYKSMSLKLLGKYEESLKILLEDYQFEIDHNQQADANKSRYNLFMQYLDNNMVKQAKKYMKDKDEQLTLNYVIERRDKMAKHFSQKAESLLKYSKQYYIQFLDDIDNSNYYLLYDYRLADQYLQETLEIYKNNRSIRALFYYYIAECNYQLHNYAKADRSIAEALKLHSGDEVQRRDWEIEQLMIWSKISTYRQKIEPRYAEIMKEISSKLKSKRDAAYETWLETQKQHLIEVFQQFKKYENKAKDPAKYSFNTQEENQMLLMLERAQDRTKKPNPQKQNKQKYDLRSRSSSEEKFLIQEDVQMIRPKKQIFNHLDEYIRKCTEYGLPQRQEIRQALRNGNLNFNPLPKYFNLCILEVQLIVQLFKMDNLDLRNHMANDNVLASIPNHAIVRRFKLSGVNTPSNQTILKTLAKMSSLEYLSFTNFSALRHRSFYLLDKAQLKGQEMAEEPRSLIHALLLLNYVPGKLFQSNILRVLKLKYCNLSDGHLQEMDFSLYPNLKEVSLSHNLLEGRSLAAIMTLENINKINLSDNPLRTLALSEWRHKFIKMSQSIHLKLRQIIFSQELANDLSIVLERVKTIDLSRSKELNYLITTVWHKYLEGLCLNELKEWRMTGIDLDEINLNQFIGLLSSCHQLTLADLRFCKHNYCLQSTIHQLLGESKIDILISSTDINPEIDNFDLPTIRHHT